MREGGGRKDKETIKETCDEKSNMHLRRRDLLSRMQAAAPTPDVLRWSSKKRILSMGGSPRAVEFGQQAGYGYDEAS